MPRLEKHHRLCVLWFLCRRPIAQQRRATLRYLLQGAPYTTNDLYAASKAFESQICAGLLRRGRRYRTHCKIDVTEDLFELVMRFLV